ncbi:MAG: response regulator [Deltaproteobacteria bacterium]|nr:MAG: response regulator [Deltaproteobacteria bacterium]
MDLKTLTHIALESEDLGRFLARVDEILRAEEGVLGTALHLKTPFREDLHLTYLSGVRIPSVSFQKIPSGTFPNSEDFPETGILVLPAGDSRVRPLLSGPLGISHFLLLKLTPPRGQEGLFWIFTKRGKESLPLGEEKLQEVRELLSLVLPLLTHEGIESRGKGESDDRLISRLGEVAASPDVGEILKTAAEILREVAGAECSAVVTREARSGPYAITHTVNFPRGYRSGGRVLPQIFHALMPYPSVVKEVSSSLLTKTGLPAGKMRWLSVGFPLHRALILLGGVPEGATKEDLEEKLRPVSSILEQMIELARRRGRERDYIDKFRLIGEMAHDLLEEKDLKTLVEKIFSTLNRVITFPRGAFYLYDREAGTLRMIAHKNIPFDLIPLKERTALRRHHGFVKETLTPILSGDTRKDPRLEYIEGMDYPVSVLCVPIVFQGEYRGDITLSAMTEDYFSEDDLVLATLFSSIAAFVLENHHLRQAAAQDEKKREISEKISTAIVREFDIGRVISLALREIKDFLELTAAAYLRSGEEEFTVREFVEDVKFFSRKSRFPAPDLRLLLSRATGPLLLGEKDLARLPLSGIVEKGVTSAALIPVREDGSLSGALFFAASAPDRFTSSTLSWLNSMATQISIAVKKANLVTRLEETVQALQETQEQMVQTEKFRALGQLASGIAHDMNNTLAAILGRCEVLLEKAARGEVTLEELLESVRVISKISSDGAETVRRLQAYTRQSRKETSPVDLNALADDVVAITSPHWKDEAEKRDLRFSVTVEKGDIPPVSANEGELREAVVNLVLNALEAMPAGGEVTITTGMREGKVFISVKDTGKGIPKEHQDRIFDPFFTTKPSGTGLGLSLVRGVVDRYGGEIEFSSWEGGGTIFTLLFPPADKAEEEKPAPLDPKTPPPAGGKPPKVFVVDDQRDVLEVMLEQLRLLGYEAEGTHDPSEALERIPGGDYDVVISDIGMPGISGWSLLERLRERGCRVPLLFVTGWADGISREDVVAKGASGVISKPFRPGDVKKAVEEVLAGEPAKGGKTGSR